MQGHIFTFENTEYLEEMPKFDCNGNLPNQCVAYKRLIDIPDGSHDEVEKILLSGVLGHIQGNVDNPYHYTEILNGERVYVQKRTTTEYTIIKGGSPELFAKFNCDYLHKPENFYMMGGKILTMEEWKEIQKSNEKESPST